MIWFRALLLGVIVLRVYGQCDPEVQRLVAPKNPVPYVARPGGRCEGLYDPERAGNATLLLVSYISLWGAFDPDTETNVRVRWATPASGPVQLRGYALRPRTYYQMDAMAQPPSSEFVWPLDVVRQVRLARRELAMVARTSYKSREVYLPLEISGAKAGPTVPRISILPGKRLNEVYLTVASLGADLAPVSSLLKEDPLGYGSYPAEDPIPIDLARLKIIKTGFYSVRIGATVVGGPPAMPLNFTLYAK